jgi:tetratricopeptide (TPR) repeat protein
MPDPLCDDVTASFEREFRALFTVTELLLASAAPRNALAAARRTIATLESLAPYNVNNLGFQALLARSHRLAARANAECDEPEAALAELDKSASILAPLLGRDEAIAIELGEIWFEIADGLTSLGRHDEALRCLHKAFALLEWSNADGRKLYRQMLLHGRIGDALAALGRSEEALAAYQNAHRRNDLDREQSDFCPAAPQLPDHYGQQRRSPASARPTS